MSPKLGSIFPNLMGDEIRAALVDKIQLSKSSRRMRIIFENSVSEDIARRAAQAVKAACNLNEVIYEINQKKAEIKLNVFNDM